MIVFVCDAIVSIALRVRGVNDCVLLGATCLFWF